ncbi:dinitrogenase iron-molybdenum cofactor biosynthesis protein [Halorhabdus sp. CBA1104]|uniref:NifB/NifX family molybdenum-iron cluster-binding protein n=1 Tax=Halorhabdus sp. CBA1104 TaxID=1380432 RepID=UPI0012B2C9BD|nr:NifB/NifX family molybdenum-iron cluster-binding protein [Halorhabdus sp. CBA1104]QGN06733.1 dinitrogenase iron-molybdenum cofactor biosynthesis protein [Halorhabdus sp. CBA1104]
MLLCVPSLEDGTLGAPVSPHFGRAPNYTLLDTEAESVEVIDNDGQHHGGRRSPPKIIAETGADVLLCGNLGQKAVERFDAMDIEVYCGTEGTVAEALEQFEAGDLEVATPDGSHCNGHEGHDHSQGRHHEHHAE